MMKKGIMYYKDGTIQYEGNYINDMPEGKGKFVHENGEYYIGEFQNGLRNGKGTIYYKDGKIYYEGDFVNGNGEGNGKIIYEDGSYYIGQFKNDEEGQGKSFNEDGSYFIGQFKNGYRFGEGKKYDKEGKFICDQKYNIGECIDERELGEENKKQILSKH